jgi:hypothetical protein
MPTCPLCGLINLEEARACDCGFDFGTSGPEVRKMLDAARATARRAAIRGTVLGLGAIGGSIVLLAMSHRPTHRAIMAGVAISSLALAGRSIARLRQLGRSRRSLDTEEPSGAGASEDRESRQ